MIGWWIVVSTHSPKERDRANPPPALAMLPLIKGGGIQPHKDGFWIFGIDEGEEYAQPPGWMGKIKVHADRVAACPTG